MEYELDISRLSKLNRIVTEYSKKYFTIKNNYYNQIIEIQDFLADKVDICDLIDTQYTLIKELTHLVNFLFNELSFRKCIIERKDHVLKDLNKVIINKFIDKIYKQEIQIAELQKEKNILQKIKNNTISFPKMIQFDNQNIKRATHVSNSNSNNNPQRNVNSASAKAKGLPVNVVIPKNNSEYNGAYSFFNSSIKNIERFINIKNVNITGDNKTKEQPTKSVPRSRRGGNSNSMNHLSTTTIKQSRPKTVKSRNENFNNSVYPYGLGLSATNKTNISNISMNASNISIASTMTLNKTFTRNLLPSKQATSLLNKSYELVKKYQKSNRARSAHAKSLF